MTADGHTYDRPSIEKWFQLGHSTSPLTNKPLPNKTLVPNFLAKSALSEHLSKLRSTSEFWEDLKSGVLEKLRASKYPMECLESTFATDTQGWRALPLTPLQYAASHSKDVLEWLLDSGVAVSQSCGRGCTALHHAVSWSRTDCISVLLKRGANVNARDKAGYSALHRASAFSARPLRVISMLLAAGAEVNARNTAGQSPLQVARCLDVVKTLVEAKAEITSLELAALLPQTDSFDYLVSRLSGAQLRSVQQNAGKDGDLIVAACRAGSPTALKTVLGIMNAVEWEAYSPGNPVNPIVAVCESKSDAKSRGQCFDILAERFGRARVTSFVSRETLIHVELKKSCLGHSASFIALLLRNGAVSLSLSLSLLILMTRTC